MKIQPLLTTKEVCAIFKKSDKTIHNWRKDKKKNFPEPKVLGYPNMWDPVDIENYINQKPANAA